MTTCVWRFAAQDTGTTLWGAGGAVPLQLLESKEAGSDSCLAAGWGGELSPPAGHHAWGEVRNEQSGTEGRGQAKSRRKGKMERFNVLLGHLGRVPPPPRKLKAGV